MKSGSVKVGTGVVQIDPIEGPGMCGADFPLKVSALGESSPLVGYADDPRPPGSIPNSAQMPRWPINQPQYTPPAPIPSAAPARGSQSMHRACGGCADHLRPSRQTPLYPPAARFH
jgi:hypothetical protein